MRVRFAAIGMVFAALSVSSSAPAVAQTPPATAAPSASDPAPRASTRTARTIHERGMYPDDLLVEPEPEADGAGESGAAPGRRLPIPVYGGQGAPRLSEDPPASLELPDWLKDLRLPRWFAELFAMLGYGALALVLIVVAVVVGGVVYLLFRMRPRLDLEVEGQAKKRVRPQDAETVDAADPLLAMPELGHDELARQGRYREAVHALLVTALLSTGWRPEGRGRGMTAREITSGYAKTSPPREPLDALLVIVERIWFGGRDATESSYAEALREFRAFVPDEAGAP